MRHFAKTILVVCAALPFPAARAQESGQAQRPSDKQEQKGAVRKSKEKEAAPSQQQAGVRCTRIKRTQ